MKKYLIIASILLLAAACGKQTQTAVTSQPADNNQPAAQQPSTRPTSTPPTKATSTKPVYPVNPGKLTLSAYTDPSKIFSVNYTSDFVLLTAIDLAAKISKSENTSACGAGADVCFVLKGAPYKGANFVSAAVSVRVRADKSDIGQCADFSKDELGIGHLNNPVSINGSVFVSALADQEGTGKLIQTQMSRGFYKKTCYEIDETISWTNASSLLPLDKSLIWPKLDALRGGFRFAS